MPLLSDDDINDLNNAFCNSNFRQNFLMALRETIIKEVIDSLPDFKDQMLAAIWTATHPRDMHVIFPKHYYWNDEVHFRGRGRKVRDVVRQMDILRDLETTLGPTLRFQWSPLTWALFGGLASARTTFRWTTCLPWIKTNSTHNIHS